jgi:hypothetical protein
MKILCHFVKPSLLLCHFGAWGTVLSGQQESYIPTASEDVRPVNHHRELVYKNIHNINDIIYTEHKVPIVFYTEHRVPIVFS